MFKNCFWRKLNKNSFFQIVLRLQRTFKTDLFNGLVLNVRHITQNRENNKSSKETRQTINTAGEDGISVTIVIEFIVAGEGEQGAKAGP